MTFRQFILAAADKPCSNMFIFLKQHVSKTLKPLRKSVTDK